MLISAITANADIANDFFKRNKELAEQGDARAQGQLASSYALGNGTPQNIPKALEWAKKSADQGNDIGLYQLGYFYTKGIPKKDMDKGVELLKQSAEKGNMNALNCIMALYTLDLGAPTSTPQGAKWAFLWLNTLLNLQDPSKASAVKMKISAIKARVPADVQASLLEESQGYAAKLREVNYKPLR